MIASKIRALALFGLVLASASAAHADLSWVIYSTDAKGNPKNTFRSPTAVHLAGGPHPKTACTGIGLPDGVYYFQVTNPSGTVLLSTDILMNRRINVVGGVFDSVPAEGHATRFGPCESKVVQLAPFLPTLDGGGEYKVWITPVEKYQDGLGIFGFLPQFSETDNFITRLGPLPEQTVIRGTVFYDFNLNGVYDPEVPEEVPIPGWKIQISSSTNTLAAAGDAGTTFTDEDGHFEFLRSKKSGSYILTSVAPTPGFIPAVGAQWLATTSNPVGVITNAPTVTADFGNVYFVNTPELARSKGYWHLQGRAELLAIDPQWRELLNGYCLRTNLTSPPNPVEATLFAVPLGVTFATAYDVLSNYLVGTPDNGVLINTLSTQFTASLLNHNFGALQGIPTYIDQMADGILVSLEVMIEHTATMLCDPRSANTGPGGDEEWRDHIRMCMNEWDGMNTDGTNLFTRAKRSPIISYE